jgi:hypothetical protein
METINLSPIKLLRGIALIMLITMLASLIGYKYFEIMWLKPFFKWAFLALIGAGVICPLLITVFCKFKK